MAKDDTEALVNRITKDVWGAPRAFEGSQVRLVLEALKDGDRIGDLVVRRVS